MKFAHNTPTVFTILTRIAEELNELKQMRVYKVKENPSHETQCIESHLTTEYEMGK